MENKLSLNDQLRHAAVEKMWLNHFNNGLLEQGLITPDQHRKMKVYINTRKTSSGER